MPLNESSRDKPISGGDLLQLQLEANQELLLAALRAAEQVDELQGAQRRAEQELDTLKADEQELRTTAEFRERLIGIIGHDLRTPLNAILMASGLLISRGHLVATEAMLATRILSSAQRMVRMIGQLADFTRARLGGGFALDIAPVDMGEICRDVVNELRLASTVALQQTSRGDLHGAWDADRLTQALINIAGNAVDHAAPATPVLIDAHEEDQGVAVEITNTGPCIPPELLPQIFTAFRRAETSTAGRSGHLGLGLFVACEITRAHGGTLGVRSSEGSTTFTMRLPRVTTKH